jgi:uncharacterized protein (TIGR00369 family)
MMESQNNSSNQDLSEIANSSWVKQPNSRHCFVCGIENDSGLKLRFFKNSSGEVLVDTVIPDQFQGYPGVVHGGIVAPLVDEVLGRVHMGENPENSRFMYTLKLCVHYRKPVPTNKPIRIIGRVARSKSKTATSTARILDQDGHLLVEADALLINIPEENLKSLDYDDLGWKVYPD